MPACNADLGGQAGALGPHGVLDHLHHDGATFEHLFFNGHQRLARAGSGCLAFGVFLPNIGHMQKSCFVETNVDEGRLHAGQNTGHFAQVHIPHQTAFQRALDMQLLHRAKLDHRDPCFLGRPIDQNILLHEGHQKGGVTTTNRSPQSRGAPRQVPTVNSERPASAARQPSQTVANP